MSETAAASMAESAPNPELLSSLGRLVRGTLLSQVRSEKRSGTFVVLDERGARLPALSSYAPVEPRPLARMRAGR